jgi:hypothetical protein
MKNILLQEGENMVCCTKMDITNIVFSRDEI